MVVRDSSGCTMERAHTHTHTHTHTHSHMCVHSELKSQPMSMFTPANIFLILGWSTQA